MITTNNKISYLVLISFGKPPKAWNHCGLFWADKNVKKSFVNWNFSVFDVKTKVYIRFRNCVLIHICQNKNSNGISKLTSNPPFNICQCVWHFLLMAMSMLIRRIIRLFLLKNSPSAKNPYYLSNLFVRKNNFILALSYFYVLNKRKGKGATYLREKDIWR